MPNTLTNAPIASHTLAQDQPLMQFNNLYYGNTLNVDHQIGPADGTHNDGQPGEGYHKVIHFVNQLVDPAIVANTGELYTKTVGAFQQLFYQNASGNVIQMTNYSSNVNATARFGTNTTYQAAGGGNAAVRGGWSFLPGGLIYQYGAATTLNPGGSITVKFAIPFNNIFNVVATPRTSTSIGGGTHDWDVGALITTSFDLTINANYDSSDIFYFYAIGN